LLACAVLLLAFLHPSLAPSELIKPGDVAVATDEPISPLAEPVPSASPRIALGERLFRDPRLSRDGSRSCASCHDLSANGAGNSVSDLGVDGSVIPLNTLSVFNAALNFRFNWQGTFRTLESQAAASFNNAQIMNVSMGEVAARLRADPDMRRDFAAAYDAAPDANNILDAIASFERTLVTPGSKFDRWLAGDVTALSLQESSGYRLFKSLGCVSCHQGANIGGNLFARQGIFHPMASPKPEVLRVPSLRNVATTAPYFHDGSAPTLSDAVRKMGFAQLNSRLDQAQIDAIVAFLGTLTGNYRGEQVGAAR
jgi:cytochrome c peroxidase